jgi:hypothetical protein
LTAESERPLGVEGAFLSAAIENASCTLTTR